MALPILAGIVRVTGVTLARATTVSVARLATVARSGATRLGVAYGRLIATFGNSARTLFKGKTGKPAVRVDARRALLKLQRIDGIIEEVFKDALPEMKRHTAKRSGYARNNQRLVGKTTLNSSAEYSSYIDRSNFQKNKVSPEGRKYGFSKPTKDFITKEIKSRIKKELGR